MEYKLCELFDLQMGKTPDRNKRRYWNNGTEDWIAISDLGKCGKYIEETKEKISELAVENSKIKVIPPNTVVMSFKLTIGKVAITKKKMYSNEAIMAFHDKKVVKMNPSYIYYLLMGQDWNEGTNKAVMGKTLNKATLLNRKIKIHSIEDQEYVTKLLDLVSDTIENEERQLESYNTLIKSRFVEMFGNPSTNPMNWKKGTLGEYMTLLTDFSSNGSYKTLDSNVVMKDTLDYAWMVRTTDLETGNENGRKYIDEWTWNFLEKSKIYGDEIIMCKIGSAGKIYLMPNIGKPASLGRNAFMFRFNDALDRVYLFHLLTTDYGNSEIMQYVRGAVTKTITKDDVRKIRIMVPPIDKQKEFVSYVEQVDKLKAAQHKRLEQTQILFDSLMQQYFG